MYGCAVVKGEKGLPMGKQ